VVLVRWNKQETFTIKKINMGYNWRSTDWNPMTKEEIDKHRLKAYLSFDEEDEVAELEPPYKLYKYKNSRGEDVVCRILIRRESGEIVVQNINGVRVCLTEDKLLDLK
jgi:hypothetical protein